MKRIITVLCIILICLMQGCKQASEREQINLWIVPDLHYLSQELYRENSVVFQKVLEGNDGKMIELMPKVLEDLKDLAVEEHPDAILVPGDLTFNGEYLSLLDVKAYFHAIKEAGIPVYVIPGNHDIAYPWAYDMTGDIPVGVQNISSDTFQELMDEFGYEDAVSKAEDSFSYIVSLADDLWLMSLDANTEDAPGALTAETLSWAEEKLRYAVQQDIHVITMTHQNVLSQSPMFSQGYVINNAAAVEHMLIRYGVMLNLSGHSHLQHTAVSGTFTDICTESSAVWPLGFGVLNIEADHVTCNYSKRTFRVNQQDAEERLEQTILNGLDAELSERGIPEDTKNAMINFACELNKMYYTGRLSDSTPYFEREEWELWKNLAGDSFWYLYLNEILQEFDSL